MRGSRGVVWPFLLGRALLMKLCREAFIKTSQNHSCVRVLKLEGIKSPVGGGGLCWGLQGG